MVFLGQHIVFVTAFEEKHLLIYSRATILDKMNVTSGPPLPPIPMMPKWRGGRVIVGDGAIYLACVNFTSFLCCCL